MKNIDVTKLSLDDLYSLRATIEAEIFDREFAKDASPELQGALADLEEDE